MPCEKDISINDLSTVWKFKRKCDNKMHHKQIHNFSFVLIKEYFISGILFLHFGARLVIFFFFFFVITQSTDKKH